MTTLTTVKDLPLKLRIKRILEVQGYHCPLEVALSHFESQDTSQDLKRILLTDLDVLGIRFELDLRQTIIIADCKSGRESEVNRIFWLRGIMDYFQAQEGIFLKSQMHSQARALGPRLGIRVLDEKGLAILEKGLGIDSSSFSTDDITLYQRMSSLWGIRLEPNQNPTQRQLALKSVYQYLQYNYWMVDDYVNIQTIIDRFGKIKADLSPDDLRSKYFAFVGLQRLSLSIIKMAGYVAARDLSDVAGQFKTAFFGGTSRMRTSVQIMQYLERLSEFSGIEERLQLEPPYFNELVEIVNRIVLNSRYATKILQHLDVVLTEHVFGEKRGLEEVLGITYSTEALVLLKRIAAMFVKHTGLKEELFEELWKL